MRVVGLMLLAVAMVGCQDPTSEPGEDDGEAGSTGELPSPYAESGDESGAQELPTMDAPGVVTASVAGLKAFVQLEPTRIVDAYESIAVVEPDCPTTQETYEEDGATVIVWYEEVGCKTSTGVEFRGGARFLRTSITDGEATVEQALLSSEGSSMRVSRGDGSFFEMTGYLEYTKSSTPDATEAGFSLVGNFGADKDTAAGSAVLDGSVTAQGYMYSFEGAGYKGLGGAGTLRGNALGSAKAFAFADLWLLPGCSQEPLGAMSVRDDAGFWHDVVFDAGSFDPENGDEEPTYDDANCNGCGSYLAAGETLGDACLTQADVDSLLDWEGAPW